MSSQNLPKLIDPIQYARAEQKIEGMYQLVDLPRLQSITNQLENTVRFNLQFGVDANRSYFIKGALAASVELICQRCNKPMNIQVDANISLCPVISEKQAGSLPEEYEPLVTHGELVALKTIVEDELLLALPMAVKHPVGECPAELPDYLHS